MMRYNKRNTKSYKKQPKIVSRGFKFTENGHLILFLGCALLLYLEINIYYITLIEWYIPTFLWLVSGLILTICTLNYFIEYKDFWANISVWICNIVAFGGVMVFLFLGTNRYFSQSSKERVLKTMILSTGNLATGVDGRGTPYATVKIGNLEKQLLFAFDTEPSEHKWVELTIKKGILGFDLVLVQRLI
jgi:hypothetical protein